MASSIGCGWGLGIADGKSNVKRVAFFLFKRMMYTVGIVLDDYRNFLKSFILGGLAEDKKLLSSTFEKHAS